MGTRIRRMGSVRRDSKKCEKYDSTSLSGPSESGAPMNSRDFTAQGSEAKVKVKERGNVTADG